MVSEEGEHVCEPVIDLVECPLLLGSLQDGLEVRGCGGKGSRSPKFGLRGALAHLGPSDLGGTVGTGEGREMVWGDGSETGLEAG